MRIANGNVHGRVVAGISHYFTCIPDKGKFSLEILSKWNENKLKQNQSNYNTLKSCLSTIQLAEAVLVFLIDKCLRQDLLIRFVNIKTKDKYQNSLLNFQVWRARRSQGVAESSFWAECRKQFEKDSPERKIKLKRIRKNIYYTVKKGARSHTTKERIFPADTAPQTRPNVNLFFLPPNEVLDNHKHQDQD